MPMRAVHPTFYLTQFMPKRDVAAEIKAWIKAHPDVRPSPSEVLRQILRSHLVELGMVREQR